MPPATICRFCQHKTVYGKDCKCPFHARSVQLAHRQSAYDQVLIAYIPLGQEVYKANWIVKDDKVVEFLLEQIEMHIEEFVGDTKIVARLYQGADQITPFNILDKIPHILTFA